MKASDEIELVAPVVDKEPGEWMYFREDGSEGKRQIDLVLVYEIPSVDEMKAMNTEEKEKEQLKAEKRRIFESNLREAGVEMEHEDAIANKNKKSKTQFVKLHGPWQTLANCAEEMLIKMPIKEYDIELAAWYDNYLTLDLRDKLEKYNPFAIQESSFAKPKSYYVAYFKKDYLKQFIGHEDTSTFFPQPERSRMIEHICDQTRFGEDRFQIGIKKLLYQGVYKACFPLHSGSEKLPASGQPNNDRQRLKKEWASFSRLHKFQPYHAIKDYFGTEVGLYFAWLGFYTAMLVPAAIVGLIVFIFGLGVAGSYPPVVDACNKDNKYLFNMCPLCDKLCSYWSLVDFCPYIHVVYIFDNDATVFMAIFMSIWSTLFLEFWKRRQAILSYEWHVMHYEESEEQLRPEFVATATTLKRNPVTGKMEPHIPTKQRYQRLTGGASAIMFMIFLVIGAVTGVIVYRAAIFGAMMARSSQSLNKRAKITTSLTAAVINLICISILKFFYGKLAIFLTDWENPRTRTEYEDSFTYKMFLFQFVNTYSSIFYIAFFKLNYVIGTPGSYTRVGKGYRLDGCSAGGCLFDLCLQLIVIMLGLQIIGNVFEIAIPGLKKWWNLRQARMAEDEVELPQWETDYGLEALPDHHMFWEYLEIVLQFGFVTMFVAAFPLAPLFALLNSFFELRVDAINFVDQFRRPTPTRAQDIGAWYRIMETLVNISVLVNAFVLSFTSDFIPRLVYKYTYSKDGSLEGYLNNSLSYFYINNFTELERPKESPKANLTYCRYPGYYQPNYEVSEQYWHVIAARLAFVFVFQYLVYAVTKLVAFLIPDRPLFLELKIKREAYLEKQALQQTLTGDEPAKATKEYV